MARKRKEKPSSHVNPSEDLEPAYQEWRKWRGFERHLTDRKFAFEGANFLGPKKFKKEVKKVYGRFDKAIMSLITYDKHSLGDPRVLERILQAQWSGDTVFFEELAGAVKKNVGIDERRAKNPAVKEIYYCALEYTSGDKKAIINTYRSWKSMDLVKKRRELTKGYHDLKDHYNIDESFFYTLDYDDKAKESIISQGLENFRARVRRMVEQIERGSLPLESPYQPPDIDSPEIDIDPPEID